MARRSYDHSCPAAYALDLIGERWALLVVRELLLGPKRFVDLAAGLNGIGDSVLSTRLKELERAGVIERRRLPAPASTWAYELTEFGRELEEIVLALARWGARAPGWSRGNAARPDDALFAAKASYRGGQDASGPCTVALRLDDEAFELLLGPRLDVRRGEARDPVLSIATDTESFVDLLFGTLPPATAATSGRVQTDADAPALERFVARFEPLIPAGTAASTKRVRRAA